MDEATKTGLKITILRGDTRDDNFEYFFDHSHDYIVIGRDPTICHISFAEHLKNTGLGNEHIAFKRSLGRYEIDLNTEHYVTVDDTPPYENQELTGSNILKLGESVSIQVDVIDNRSTTKKAAKRLSQLGEQSILNQKKISALVVIVAVIGLAVFFYQQQVKRIDNRVLLSQTNIDDATTQIAAIGDEFTQWQQQSDRISPETIENIKKSVYLVVVQSSNGDEYASGTAWVYDDGALATNAHVAEVFNTLKENQKLIVRSPIAPNRSHVVKQVKLHPGFKAYQNLWQSYLPAQKSRGRLELLRTVSPADVATMELENTEGLAPPLKLLPLERLSEITPGQRVGFVGYPAEQLIPGDIGQPEPVAQQDEIVRITDFFQGNQTTNTRLIQHGLPLTGGASGSPMFNAKGEVIGLISAMNISSTRSGRLPNAADINFSQRIDFLHHLNQGAIEAETEKLKEEWQQGLAHFHAGRESSQNSILKEVQSIFDLSAPDATRVLTYTEAIERDAKIKTIKNSINIDKPGFYLAIAVTNQLSIRFKAKNSDKNVNISVFQHKFDYTDFAKFILIYAQQPGIIDIELGSIVSSGNADMFEGEVALSFWQPQKLGGINGFVDTYIKSTAPLLVTTKEPSFELVGKAENVTLQANSKGNFQAAVTYKLDKLGKYSFVSIPKKTAGINAVLANKQGKTLMNPRRTKTKNNGIVLFNYSNKKQDNEVILATFSDNKNIIQNISVYYLNSE